jgi:uncharacterized coiled-coil protein SlyX
MDVNQDSLAGHSARVNIAKRPVPYTWELCRWHLVLNSPGRIVNEPIRLHAQGSLHTMMMENEQLARAVSALLSPDPPRFTSCAKLGDITDTVVELQRNIDRVRQLFSASVSRRPSSSPASSNSHSSHGRSISLLERRIEELECNKRDLTDTLSTIQDEVYNAVRAREDIMKRYRLLIRFSASLLQVGYSSSRWSVYFCSTGIYYFASRE